MVGAIERQVLQSQVMERIQQVQQRHPDMQQQYFEIQLNQERRKFSKKVNESEKIYHTTVDEEGRKQQKDHPQERETAEQAVGATATGEQKKHDHIDIKV
jgi:hypothetical protein